MKKPNGKSIVLFLMIFFSVFFITISSGKTAGTLPGCSDKAVNFTLENVLDGKTYSFADFSDKAIIITFGSRYCKPCKEMMPELNKLHEKYKSSLAVIKIDIDNEPDRQAMKSLASKLKIAYPFLIGNHTVAKQYGVIILPTSFLIDKNRVIVKKYLGFKPCSVLEHDFKALKNNEG